MIKAIAIAMICLLPFTADAAGSWKLLSPEEYERLTRESPILMDCTHDEDRGLYDCPALEQQRYAPVSEDYLPAVVPEQTRDMPPLLPSLLGTVYVSCRKVGKNSEYCSDSPNYGANEIQQGME